ncbi:MAG: hypothetical protein ABIN55_01790 [Aeromicrobium sp.]
MSDHEQAIVEVLIFFFLIYIAFLLVWTAWRRFIRDGDVVADANEILRDQVSIESYVEDWMPLSQKIAIAESRYLDKARAR